MQTISRAVAEMLALFATPTHSMHITPCLIPKGKHTPHLPNTHTISWVGMPHLCKGKGAAGVSTKWVYPAIVIVGVGAFGA